MALHYVYVWLSISGGWIYSGGEDNVDFDEYIIACCQLKWRFKHGICDRSKRSHFFAEYYKEELQNIGFEDRVQVLRSLKWNGRC